MPKSREDERVDNDCLPQDREGPLKVDIDAPLDLAEEVVQIFVDVCLTDGDWISKINEWA